MKIRPTWPRFSVALLALALLFAGYRPASAQQKAGSPLDVVVKISNLEKTMSILDELMGADPANPFSSPTFMLRGMLQGTAWIDPSRSIVIGAHVSKGEAQQAVLIPFRERNENFQAAYNASSGPDYYVLAMPPGKGAKVSSATEKALVAASGSKAKAFLTVELAAAKLLATAQGPIQEGLNKLQDRSNNQGSDELSLTPQEMQEALSSMLETARQIETLTLAFEISKKKLSTSVSTEAATGTELAKIFTPSVKTSIVDRYKPKHHINFHSQAYDVAAMMELIDDSLGNVYDRMGIDFSSLAAICRNFTGEMAGGMSYSKKGVSIEVISALKDTKSAPDFLEEVFMPWTIKYGKDMARVMEKQLGKKIQPLHVRTPDTRVAGHRVMGIKAQLPSCVMPTAMSGHHGMEPFTEYEARMTTVGSLLLVAPDDKRMSELIKMAKKLKARRPKGPFMTMDMDLAGYLGSVMEMMPGLSGSRKPLPRMGKATMVVDLRGGQANARWSINMDDIKTMIDHFKRMTPAGDPSITPVSATAEIRVDANREPKTTSPRKGPNEPPKAVKQKDPTKKDSKYWFEQGAICATYGNDKAAIRYFGKVIELNPKSSEAYFDQGISYGQLGDYEKAIAHINKALELGNRKGRYLYGRGRVHLLSGDKAKAMSDFNKAAALGSQDAQDYVKTIAPAR